MAAAAIMIGQVTAPWQLYVATAPLAFGWAGTSLAIITTTLGRWFDKKRGMAISLALNGASFGGIIGVPLLVAAIGSFGFSGAMIAVAIAVLVVMIPVILIVVGRPPARRGTAAEQAPAQAPAPSASQLRAQAFRDVAFLTISIAFALVLFAQVGFIVHLIAFLDPVIGREHAATAVALLTAMAVVGRVLFSTVIDQLNQRLASAISFASQAVAVVIIINSRNEMLLMAACALFGFSVGNLITLPSLIVQREFDSRAFGVLISLITATNQITYAFGPSVIGLLRDASGSYALPFSVCIGLQLAAAVLIMVRGRGSDQKRDLIRLNRHCERSEAIHAGQEKIGLLRRYAPRNDEDYVGRCRNRSSRSSRCVNIASEPSGLRGHCSLGRSQYSSTPFSSGSRK